MTEIITDEKLITKYQKQFVKQLKTICKEEINCIVGYQGSSDELTVILCKSSDETRISWLVEL